MVTSSTGNLHKKKQKSASISDLSQIAQLPRQQQVLLEIMLLSGEMPYVDLCATVMQLPNGHALTQAQIDGTLYDLIRMGYITSFMDGGEIIYIVQLKGKREKRDEQRLWRDLGLGTLYDEFQKDDD